TDRRVVRSGAHARAHRTTRRRPEGVRPRGNVGTLRGRSGPVIHHHSRRRAGEGAVVMTDRTDGVAANGAPTLTDRVKELRLTGRREVPKAAGGTPWLPWLLCVLLAIGWAGFGIKWYRGTPAKTNEPAADGAAASPGAGSAAKGETTDDTVALEVKGYLI